MFGYLSTLLIAFPSEKALLYFIPTIVTILFLHIVLTDMKINFQDISITIFGIVYITMFMMFIPMIRNMENGVLLIWYLLFASWGTDIFAYIVGKLIGKHKFSKISPNKSIEGCIGGIIGTVIVMVIFTAIFKIEISYIYLIIMAMVLSILSQIGDFSASSIKRYMDIKDFSNLIPGHGGMLDRIDSLIFIAPFAYLLFTLI